MARSSSSEEQASRSTPDAANCPRLKGRERAERDSSRTDSLVECCGSSRSLIMLHYLFDTNASEKEKRFVDEGEISFVNTTGNTKVTSLAVKNEMRYRFRENVSGTWKAGALYGKNDGAKNAESYNTELKLDYTFSSGIYSFADAGWKQNKFVGIDRRIYGGLGAGYAFLAGPHNFLVGEVGANYVSDEYTDGSDKDYPEGRAFAKYTYAFTEKTKFSQSAEFLDDLEDTAKYRLNSETALVAALSGNLSLKTAYLIGYVHEPQPDSLEKTDAMVLVTLVLAF